MSDGFTLMKNNKDKISISDSAFIYKNNQYVGYIINGKSHFINSDTPTNSTGRVHQQTKGEEIC